MIISVYVDLFKIYHQNIKFNYMRGVVKLTIKRWRETENIVYFCLHIRFLFIEWQKNSIIKQNVVIEDVTK